MRHKCVVLNQKLVNEKNQVKTKERKREKSENQFYFGLFAFDFFGTVVFCCRFFHTQNDSVWKV